MDKPKVVKNVAVIGVGAAGLVAIKRVTEDHRNFTCCAFEFTENIGGTWVYTDRTGKDEFGIPIHSSMYKNLRTNLPKEVMILPELPHETPTDRSYLTSDEVLQYLEYYTDYYDLRKYIKFRHFVKNIAPMPEGKWKIEVIDFKNNQKESVYYFDAVIVCVGKFSNPVIPKITNIENFKGFQLHSHDYRKPCKFKDQTVVIIGGKSSALDISFHMCTAAKKVYLSHHNDKIRHIQFPSNLEQKPDIREIQDGDIVFVDGSKVSADTILYCTGYTCKYPFLDPKCKITTEKQVVKPLYKHSINIEHPTMCFIGIPRTCPGFALFDLQISCFLSVLEGKATLPSKAEMLAELERDINERRKITGNEKYYHLLNEYAVDYCDSVAEFGKVANVRPVVFKMCFEGLKRGVGEFPHYRNNIYHIINDREYVYYK